MTLLSIHNLDSAEFEEKKSLLQALPGKEELNIQQNSLCNISIAQDVTEKVFIFIKESVEIRGIDNSGSKFISTINCLLRANASEVCRLAQWTGRQVIYGQGLVNDVLLTEAASEAIVAHEIFHAVIQRYTKLTAHGMPGALNESLADTFAILFINRGNNDIDTWSWDLGKPFGIARNFRYPERHSQPDHIDDYKHDIADKKKQHINNGIHNKAMSNVLNIKGRDNNYIFNSNLGTKLLYTALTNGSLNQKSTFLDSRNAILDAIFAIFADNNSLLGSSSLLMIENRVEEAFDDVGINYRHFALKGELYKPQKQLQDLKI